jgi:iron complex transport system ATP-binding protein
MALHDLNLAALYADRVALLVGGRLGAVGTPEAVLTPELVSSAYQIPVHIIQHPDYGTPLILPDGRM